MTFTRAWDFSGELSDLEVMTNGRLPCARSTDQAKSGSYSWKQTALDHAVVMGVPQGTTDLRSGFWIWASDDAGWGHIGIRGDMNVFKVGQQFSTNGGVRLVWYEDEERLDLQIDGVAQDTVALSTLPDWKIESWFHVAITASVTLGYASAYFNGEEILTYSGAIAHQPWDSVTCLSRRESWGFQNGGYMDDGYVDIMDGEGDTAPPMIQFLPSYTLAAGEDA